MLSIVAEPPDASAASKAVERTVISLIESDDCTVARAFPAYIGRLKVSCEITSIMSEICITSSNAAARGIIFLPKVVAGAKTWV